MQYQLASRSQWSRADAVLYRSKAVFERQLVRFTQNNQGVSSTASAQSLTTGHSLPSLVTTANRQLYDAGLFIASEVVRAPQGQIPNERLYLRQMPAVDLELAA